MAQRQISELAYGQQTFDNIKTNQEAKAFWTIKFNGLTGYGFKPQILDLLHCGLWIILENLT